MRKLLILFLLLAAALLTKSTGHKVLAYNRILL